MKLHTIGQGTNYCAIIRQIHEGWICEAFPVSWASKADSAAETL